MDSSLLVIALLGAFAIAVSKIAKRFVPEIVIFLVLGLAIGPDGPMRLINERNSDSLDLLTQVALGAVIFTIGDRLRLDDLRRRTWDLVPVNAAQLVLSAGLVFAATRWAGATPQVALILGLIAAESGILTISATVKEERAHGPFTDLLMASVGVTNVAVALLFGLALPFVLLSSGQGASWGDTAQVFGRLVVLSTAIGLAGGWLLRRFSRTSESSGELLLLLVVVLTGVVGAAVAADGSVVVSTLVAGLYVANAAPWLADRLFAAVRTLEAPIYLVFFVVAGASIHVDELASVGLVGAAYVAARLAGKVAGAAAGGLLAPGLRSGEAGRVGLALLPHAGMAIGLVALVVEQAPWLGGDVSAVVLGSIVAFELGGPIAARRALRAAEESGKGATGGRRGALPGSPRSAPSTASWCRSEPSRSSSPGCRSCSTSSARCRPTSSRSTSPGRAPRRRRTPSTTCSRSCRRWRPSATSPARSCTGSPTTSRRRSSRPCGSRRSISSCSASRSAPRSRNRPGGGWSPNASWAPSMSPCSSTPWTQPTPSGCRASTSAAPPASGRSRRRRARPAIARHGTDDRPAATVPATAGIRCPQVDVRSVRTVKPSPATGRRPAVRPRPHPPTRKGAGPMSEPEASEPILGDRFDEALHYASQLHRRQLRKGKEVPYVGHLLGTAALVLEDGGDEDETIAALLHDAVEDQGGVPVLNEIRRRFGPRVTEIVEHCTDHDPAKDRPPWDVRKRQYVAALAAVDDSCVRVALADKLSNAREILADYRQVGEQVWMRFSAERRVLGYLRALADTFATRTKSPMADELNRVVSEIERMAETTDTS